MSIFLKGQVPAYVTIGGLLCLCVRGSTHVCSGASSMFHFIHSFIHLFISRFCSFVYLPEFIRKYGTCRRRTMIRMFRWPLPRSNRDYFSVLTLSTMYITGAATREKMKDSVQQRLIRAHELSKVLQVLPLWLSENGFRNPTTSTICIFEFLISDAD